MISVHKSLQTCKYHMAVILGGKKNKQHMFVFFNNIKILLKNLLLKNLLLKNLLLHLCTFKTPIFLKVFYFNS